jgi:nucleotide-binding universal stress UspA family protein
MVEETEVSASHKTIVGVDGSSDSMAALRRAKVIGSAMHAELYLVHVRHEPYWWSLANITPAGADAQFRRIVNDLAAEVETAVKKEMSTYQGRWSYQVRDGNPAEQLLAVGDEIGAVAVTVGARGHRPLSPYLLGSVSTTLLHRAPVSVLVVRGPDPDSARLAGDS